ncbi:hypothetical protein QUC31_008687 [Theobroma cacao]|uniref:Pentatricopeptide repeat-containing-like protein n=1 Tax=Theobroma cacao TaxID=3641 RepID=A0A061G3Z8_THECC|nr:Pentatricopeptide repeat-containing-like protein [Theobroma cacao]
MSYYQRRYRRESYGHGGPRMSRPNFPQRVLDDTGSSWQPLPAWERRFCVVVGAMPWKRFVQAKNNLYRTDKVYEWNDSAGKKAFDEAKQRFWAEFHGFPCKKHLPSADLYIDANIDWNPEIDPELVSGIRSSSDNEGKEVTFNKRRAANEVVKEIDYFSIPLDQIKATGWDE